LPHLTWSPPAIRDVQRLYRFLAPKNRNAASRAVQAIRKGVVILAEHPGAGRPAECMDESYREWPIEFGDYGYVALYRFNSDNVVIVNVRHGREEGY
jgi:plasmid stabilization system protein ParE